MDKLVKSNMPEAQRKAEQQKADFSNKSKTTASKSIISKA